MLHGFDGRNQLMVLACASHCWPLGLKKVLARVLLSDTLEAVSFRSLGR
jgi:hypothetical protein